MPVAAPLLICVMIKSSSEMVNAITKPERIAGEMMGKMTFIIALNGFAPRSSAASYTLAKELIYTADIIDAAEAYRIGLANKVVEPEALMEEAMKMATKIASKAPIAVRYSKEAINTGIQTDIDSAIAIEANLFGLCFASEDQKEGMGAFLKKEAPQFKNK